jgi:hypothetical protein
MEMAKEFFPRYFPEKAFDAFACGTWLFDPQFQQLLPASSNIVRFQKEFYLYPFKGDDSGTFHFVFGEKPSDLSLAPRDTLLRRKILEHIAAGGHFYAEGGFILMNDLHWGQEVYQKDWKDCKSV